MADKEKLEEVAKRCDNAFDLLTEIRKQIEQIIEFKKRNPAGGRDEQLRRQIGAYMAALENLVNINKNIESAAKDVKTLCNEARLLLTKGVVARKTVGLGLGGKPTTEEEGEDDRIK